MALAFDVLYPTVLGPYVKNNLLTISLDEPIATDKIMSPVDKECDPF